jgi:hypothetical protein
MVPGRLYFSLFLPALRDHRAALLAIVAFLGSLLHRIDGRARRCLQGCWGLFPPNHLFGIRQTVSDRSRIHWILVILNSIHNQDIFRSDLRQQDRDVCSIANRSWRDGIQSMHEQPYTINEFSCTSAALVSGFAKLGEQLAKRSEFYSPVPFFKFVLEVTERLQSRNMNADVGGQVPEDSAVGLGFVARPFTVALERLDLHFEARFNGLLPHRPVKMGLQQGVDICRNGFGVLE